MNIKSVVNLCEDFDSLVDESESEGYHFLTKMKLEWINNINRFHQEREVLFEVRNNFEELVAIGGLNVDPYTHDLGVGRIRHVYVSATYRGIGVGYALVDQIIKFANGKFQVLRLRTHNPQAANFYKKFGFVNEETTNNNPACFCLKKSIADCK